MVKNFLITILTAIILTMFSLFLINTKPKINRLSKDLTELKTDYDSLLLAKQDVFVEYDTITDTFYVNNPVPSITFDTIFLEQPIEANWYIDSLVDTNVVINYAVLAFGTVRHIDISYNLFKKTTTINNIVYKDREVKVPFYQPKRTLTAYNAFSSDLSQLHLGVVYTTKKGLSFSISHLRGQYGNFTTLGVGYTIAF